MLIITIGLASYISTVTPTIATTIFGSYVSTIFEAIWSTNIKA